MRRVCLGLLLSWLVVEGAAVAVRAAEAPAYTRKEDVIYGRKFGTALTMDVFTPKKDANGAAVVWVVSGGWVSAHELIVPAFPWAPVNELVKRGYTVFAVVHGSQPKYTIPEILQDMHRAVRYIRHHAKDYKIDPDRIGITGGSAGGHLSLMQGTAGDKGNAKAGDLVDRASSRVQAVACFFPPTDFLNYGKAGENALGRGILKDFKAPFDFHELNRKSGHLGRFEPITDEKKILEIGRHISPINHVTADDPPTLIIHGDKDFLVPIQQAEAIVAKLKKVGVPAKLVVKKGAGHGWADLGKDMATIGDWFDKYLKKPVQAEKDADGVASKLAEKISLPRGIEGNTPLKEALEFLSEGFGLTIVIDTAAFQAQGDKAVETSPVELKKQIKVPLGQVLKLLLKQVKGTYQVKKDHIVIVPAKK